LVGPEGRHAATVRRIRPGEEIELSDGIGGVAAGEVVAAGRDELDITVTEVRTTPSPNPRIVLIQALLKGDRSELAVELATEVGIDAIVPWNAERCVARWAPDRAAKHLDRWRNTAIAAAKQSRRDWWPVVENLATTEEVGRRLANAGLPGVLHESGTASFSELELPAAGDIVLVVGPEGGIGEWEMAHLLGVAGAPAYRLGHNVFRGSSAGAFAAAALSSRLGRWA
jgi:16S rRNA (uracil1498-N3)-methyltransferase